MEFYYVKDPYLDIRLPSDPNVASIEFRHVNFLGECTKEINCLYMVFKILGLVDSSVDNIMQMDSTAQCMSKFLPKH